MIYKYLSVIYACCLAFSLSTTAGIADTPPPSQPLPQVTVQARQVLERAGSSQVELVATIQAVQQAAIAAKVTGTITELPVVLGSRVTKGDILVKISAEEISARLLQVQAQLAQAERNLAREQKLLKKNATTPETVKSLQDILAVTRASFKEAKTMLGYTTINAPFDGVITRKHVNSGDLATPGIPLLRLENDTRLQAVTAVPESLVSLLQEGDKLSIQVPSAGADISGTVAEIAPTIDPLSRTAPVKIDISYDPALRTGQFSRVILPIDPATSLFVPLSAVIPFGQMNKVFVLENGKADLRLVRIGARIGDEVEILSGLTAEDQVIVKNNRLLINGQPVTVGR